MSEEKVIDTMVEEPDTALSESGEVLANSNVGVALAGGVVGALLMVVGVKTWKWIQKKKHDREVEKRIDSTVSEDENTEE